MKVENSLPAFRSSISSIDLAAPRRVLQIFSLRLPVSRLAFRFTRGATGYPTVHDSKPGHLVRCKKERVAERSGAWYDLRCKVL